MYKLTFVCAKLGVCKHMIGLFAFVVNCRSQSQQIHRDFLSSEADYTNIHYQTNRVGTRSLIVINRIQIQRCHIHQMKLPKS